MIDTAEMPYGNHESVDRLELSVRASHLLCNAGVMTIGDLRAADLGKIGLTKLHRKEIAKALAGVDRALAGASEERVEAVVTAFAKCSFEERNTIRRRVTEGNLFRRRK